MIYFNLLIKLKYNFYLYFLIVEPFPCKSTLSKEVKI